MRQCIVGRQYIVGVQDSDDIARRHLDALVDGIIHPLVWLTDPAHPAIELWFVALEQIDCAILAATVNNDILDIDALLRQDAINRR